MFRELMLKQPYLEVRLDINKQQYVIEDLRIIAEVKFINNDVLYKLLKERGTAKIQCTDWFVDTTEAYTLKRTMQFAELIPIRRYVEMMAIETLRNYGRQ